MANVRKRTAGGGAPAYVVIEYDCALTIDANRQTIVKHNAAMHFLFTVAPPHSADITGEALTFLDDLAVILGVGEIVHQAFEIHLRVRLLR